MRRSLLVQKAGPGVCVQDRGHPGYLAQGLSQGGAADLAALDEGAVLLGQSPDLAAIEMAGVGGAFAATEDIRIALTGAPMRASLDGATLAWNASHLLPKGAVLTIGPAQQGVYGYLHLGGGVDVPARLGSRATHVPAGLGAMLAAGDTLPLGPDQGRDVGMTLCPVPRFGGGVVRVLPSLQTDLFPDQVLERFQQTEFHRDHRGNRMGVRMDAPGQGFGIEGGLTVLSEVIVPGDIQITGDGTPFVLLADCQTTGGYPRIGTVLPCDLPIVAQAMPSEGVRFAFVSMQAAMQAETSARQVRAGLRQGVWPLVRDVHDIADLLSYQLISGFTAGDEE